MNRLFKFLGCGGCFIALAAMTGGHWTTLQTIAWTRMIIDYSRHAPLSVAIALTFDGRHPCILCLNVQQGRQQEQSEDSKLPWLRPEQSPELFCHARRAPVVAPPQSSRPAVPFVPRLHADFVESPPSPPPRA